MRIPDRPHKKHRYGYEWVNDGQRLDKYGHFSRRERVRQHKYPLLRPAGGFKNQGGLNFRLPLIFTVPCF